MNLLAELRCLPRQIENVDLQLHGEEAVPGKLDHAPALRHLAGTSVLAAWRAVDDEDARSFAWIVMARLSRADRVASREPIDGDVVVGISMARSRLAGEWRFAGVAVGVPGRGYDRIELFLQGLKDGVAIAAAIALLEFVARQFDRRHAFADIGRRHR